MEKIDINLANRKEGAFMVPALAAFAAIFALLLSFYNLNAYYRNGSHIRSTSERVKMLEGRLSQGDGSIAGDVDMKSMRRDIDFINGFAGKKIFSWTGLLTELEETLPDGIYLLQVSPDFEKSMVNIRGMARSMDDVLMAIDRMGAGKFEKVFLTKHSKDHEKQVIFDISAQYRAKH